MSKLVFIVGEGFEDSEFQVPYEYFKKAGHDIDVMGLEAGVDVHGKRDGTAAHIDRDASQAYPDEYDAMVIPGGFGPDRLRTDQTIVDFIKGFVSTGKPVAAICHGPQLLIEADKVRGRTLTSWPSVRTDLLNAGAIWVDDTVVIDGNLITSRKPDDLDAFCKALDEMLQHTPVKHSHHGAAQASGNDVTTDEEGFLTNPDAWDESIAQRLAEQEGLGQLTEPRWQIIYALREYYQQFHGLPDMRTLCKSANQEDAYCLEREFENDGSKAWRIAGLPNPGEEIKTYL